MEDTEEIQLLKKKLSWYERRYGPYIEKRGLHNWRNLFRKPNLYEWTVLIMLLMSLFIAWAYLRDTELCRDTIENIDQVCVEITKAPVQQPQTDIASTEELSKLIGSTKEIGKE